MTTVVVLLLPLMVYLDTNEVFYWRKLFPLQYWNIWLSLEKEKLKFETLKYPKEGQHWRKRDNSICVKCGHDPMANVDTYSTALPYNPRCPEWYKKFCSFCKQMCVCYCGREFVAQHFLNIQLQVVLELLKCIQG